MAIEVMKEAGDIIVQIPNDAAFLGVLSLDGSIKPVDGMLPAIITSRKENFKILYLPHMNLPLTHVDGIEFRFVETLQEVIQSFSGQFTAFSVIPSILLGTTDVSLPTYDKDFQHVFGHQQAKRALEIATAGGHNVLMVSPPKHSHPFF